ncbi:hypothetical protein A2955_03255 [Candidatus Woesebacteria bacterium RIFCSPLOWO2_01_FULL_37_19]|uniref:VanZ-like domain-containing protein n=1 Tax=Candidatus Woesebacteria bacterium RIFCSPLOWO2_01_FULL_37_19 TaxID=1802514 RepID=A0A1F8B4Q2_9BACT|nr:MAG: hypothetical protein A2955_03255 [Candidatus Woesebacteria bacterium RIFCSPLOWO2_01_FULL_37_19]
MLKILTSKNRFVRYWLPPLIWALVIFVFSSLPSIKASNIYWKEFFIKKSGHMVEYGIFTVLLYRAFLNYLKDEKKAGLYSTLMSSFYGASDEFHQLFTPGREPTVRDFLFDSLGSILAILIIWKVINASQKLKNFGTRLELIKKGVL